MLQMELVRRAAAGRLAEILGSDWIEHDKRARIIGLHRHAQRVAEHLAPDTREALEAYAAGINHYLRTAAERVVFTVGEHTWTPEPWTVADSIAVWMRFSEFFDRSWEQEVTALRNAGGGVPYERRGFRVIDKEAAVVTEADFARTNPEAYRRLKARSLQSTGSARTAESAWEGLQASHAWAVSGERTVTGKPLLESDPQIPVTLPSLWYEIHLHGETFNARGIGVPGAPGFLVGWNEHLAWGATALGSDNVDLFLERLDPEGKAYAYQGDWLPLQTRVERIDVLGAEPVYITVRETHHAPLVDDLLPNRRRGEHFSLHYVVTQELHTSIDGLLAMMRATDWESFKEGLRRYHSPGLHIVYADVYGNIGYHTAAAIPIRQGVYGLPQVGWTGEEEWAGYIPFDELPQSLNPERGFVASANHLPVGDWYPYNLTVASSGHNPRSLRLYELLSERDDFSVDVFEREVHRDNVSPVARDFIDLARRLRERNLLTPQAARVLDVFDAWDGRMIEGDPQSELGEVLLATMHRSLGDIPGTERLAARFGGGFPGIIHLLRVVRDEHERNEASPWDEDVARWMSVLLEQIGTQARRQAVREAQPQRMLYQTNLEGFGSLNPAADRLMPELTTVFVDTIWSQAGNSYTQIVDLSDIDNSRAVLPPGISENPSSPHYFDQVDLWVRGATRPAPLSRDAVMEYAESVQTIRFQPDSKAKDILFGNVVNTPAFSSQRRGVSELEPGFVESDFLRLFDYATRDVLNEPLHATWFEFIPDYAVKVFRWAREANPDAILLINEFDVLSERGARQYAAYVRDLLSKGAPIDAIGIQAHIVEPIEADELRRALDIVAAVGLPIHITELSIPSSGPMGRQSRQTWSEDDQAAYLQTFLEVVTAHPAVEAVTFWGLWDGDVWRDSTGLISTDGRLKPAMAVLEKFVGRESVPSTQGKARERAYLEPPDGYIYHGTSPHLPDVEAYITALGDPAIFPAVEGMHAAVPGTRPQFLERHVRDFLERVREAGRIPHLSFSLSIGDGEPVDDIIALTDTYDDLIRSIGRIIRDFGDPVFIRIGFEFNGSWNRYHPGLYPKAFRKFVDLLREEGAANFATIWCYEPDGPGDFDAIGPDGEYIWYPGDDYVDWFGIDLFQHGHFVASDDANRRGRQEAARWARVQESTYERTKRFLAMAEKHGKPVFLSEVAAVDVHFTPDHLDPDFADGKSDWELWFEPFFALLAEYPQIKGFNYMSQDYRNTKYAAEGWGDVRIQINSYILERWKEALRDERFIHAGRMIEQ